MRKTKSRIIERVDETTKALHSARVMSQDQVEALLVEGLAGKETALTRDDWTAIRNEALTQVKARGKQN